MRTITQILIDADEAENIDQLTDLYNEIKKDKHSYPLIQLQFAQEHMVELCRKMAIRDALALKDILK